METLSQHDLLALNRAIAEIYSARDLESFYKTAFSSIQSLIPYELCSCNEISLRPVRFQSLTLSSEEHGNVAGKLLPALNTHLLEHPLFPHFLSGEVVKTADYASRNQFKATGLYNEYYRHLDTEMQICFSLPVSPENVSTFALSRKTTDFSERDRLILTFLKPHLAGSLRNVRELDSIRLERDLLQKGAEAERQGVLLCQGDGVILCISAVAREMLEKYFNTTLVEGQTLPGNFLRWFETEMHPPSPFASKGNSRDFPRRVEREHLVVVKEDKHLTIKLLHDFTTGDYILVMIETDPALQLQNLQEYGFTRRESDISLWLAQGKTNVEIAIILGMSKRTAEKHLEHIFAKLGVETRGAAATILRKL
jgi:DNA-binding CsgD family transcriptional regulator